MLKQAFLLTSSIHTEKYKNIKSIVQWRNTMKEMDQRRLYWRSCQPTMKCFRGKRRLVKGLPWDQSKKLVTCPPEFEEHRDCYLILTQKGMNRGTVWSCQRTVAEPAAFLPMVETVFAFHGPNWHHRGPEPSSEDPAQEDPAQEDERDPRWGLWNRTGGEVIRNQTQGQYLGQKIV